MKVVTLDGPAGAGKSTVSRRLAERLQWRLLDTGAMYRAVTLAALRAGANLENYEELGELAESVSVRLPEGSVLLDGEDVSSLIRSMQVTKASRFIADSPRVRKRLVQWQREFADEYNVIAEGRDQGTVVFPRALVKFYVTASLGERARRRLAECEARGETISIDQLEYEIQERDARDAAREIAPMKPADDAIVIDTTGMPLERVVDQLEADIRHRISAMEGYAK